MMKTCLIVDDSSIIRKVARRILEDLEFKISEAENGEQAVATCQRELPDAILLDWNMPKMDGYDFLRALRKLPVGSGRKSCFALPKTMWRISPARSRPEPTSIL
jgi:two-component system, chemotaxis family, chemotaxis protein CheY